MATEEVSKKPLFVYIKGGIFPWTIEDFQQKLADIYEEYEDLGVISRPLYGLRVFGHMKDGIGKFAQALPTTVQRSYYAFQLDESSRIFAEEVEDGISIMMVTLHDFTDIDMMPLPKESKLVKEPSAQRKLLNERWHRFAELVSL